MLQTSLECEEEILADLQWALRKHGPSSEPWLALVAELSTQEKRTGDLQLQAFELSRRRTESGVAP